MFSPVLTRLENWVRSWWQNIWVGSAQTSPTNHSLLIRPLRQRTYFGSSGKSWYGLLALVVPCLYSRVEIIKWLYLLTRKGTATLTRFNWFSLFPRSASAKKVWNQNLNPENLQQSDTPATALSPHLLHWTPRQINCLSFLSSQPHLTLSFPPPSHPDGYPPYTHSYYDFRNQLSSVTQLSGKRPPSNWGQQHQATISPPPLVSSLTSVVNNDNIHLRLTKLEQLGFKIGDDLPLSRRHYDSVGFNISVGNPGFIPFYMQISYNGTVHTS